MSKLQPDEMFDLSIPEWAISIQDGLHFDYLKYNQYHIVSLYHKGKKKHSFRAEIIEDGSGQSGQDTITKGKNGLLYWWSKKVSPDWKETSPGHFKNLRATG
jgi:hypothetical protein